DIIHPPVIKILSHKLHYVDRFLSTARQMYGENQGKEKNAFIGFGLGCLMLIGLLRAKQLYIMIHLC
ncbi:MAG TPA: hypothetical protein PLL21_07645, partial [Sedimentibacter sp.]|nr:hypothetical protein [Sedimentibacter sp.]